MQHLVTLLWSRMEPCVQQELCHLLLDQGCADGCVASEFLPHLFNAQKSDKSPLNLMLDIFYSSHAAAAQGGAVCESLLHLF